jgi:hypothetical protein
MQEPVSIQLLKAAGRTSAKKPKPVTRKLFRHTVNGELAHFNGQAIIKDSCHAPTVLNRRPNTKPLMMDTILAQRDATRKYLKKIGVPFKIDDYRCVQVGVVD